MDSLVYSLFSLNIILYGRQCERKKVRQILINKIYSVHSEYTNHSIDYNHP
jgi:hypothetical protein